MGWADKSADLISALAAVGISATLDPRKVNPPCALIVPPDIERRTGGGVYAGWTVHLLAPGGPDFDSARWLLDQVEPVMAATKAFTAEYALVSLLDDTDPLPAYTFVVIATPL